MRYARAAAVRLAPRSHLRAKGDGDTARRHSELSLRRSCCSCSSLSWKSTRSWSSAISPSISSINSYMRPRRLVQMRRAREPSQMDPTATMMAGEAMANAIKGPGSILRALGRGGSDADRSKDNDGHWKPSHDRTPCCGLVPPEGSSRNDGSAPLEIQGASSAPREAARRVFPAINHRERVIEITVCRTGSVHLGRVLTQLLEWLRIWVDCRLNASGGTTSHGQSVA